MQTRGKYLVGASHPDADENVKAIRAAAAALIDAIERCRTAKRYRVSADG